MARIEKVVARDKIRNKRPQLGGSAKNEERGSGQMRLDILAELAKLLQGKGVRHNIGQEHILTRGHHTFENFLKADVFPSHRFPDLLLYDWSRVTLSQQAYHASYVGSTSNPRELILAQAPSDAVETAFWEMILEIGSNVVVFLDAKPAPGCSQFWSLTRAGARLCGDLQVRTETVTEGRVYTTYELALVKKKQTWYIHFLHYHVWEELDPVPPDLPSFLPRVRMAKHWQNKEWETKGKANPLTIVCDNGSSKSGTFAALYLLTDELIRKRETSLMAVAERVQGCRHGTVRSPSHYAFLYQALVDTMIQLDLTSPDPHLNLHAFFEDISGINNHPF